MLERVICRRGDADGPRRHLLGAGEHHRQLPLRARRLDGDAGRLDGEEVPRRVRGGDRVGAREVEESARGRLAGSSRARSATRSPCRRRPRGDGARGHDAGRRRQAGRRRDPGLLLRAEARRAGRRLPHVPGRDRGHAEAADRLLDAGPRRDGRLHPDRPGQARRRTRSSSSCSSTTRSTARSATRAASARCRTSRWAGARGAAASPTPSATSRSRWRSRRSSRSTASAASSATAACASARRSPRTSSCSCSSAATGPTSAPSTTAPTSRPSTATSSSSARSGALTSDAYRFRARPWDIEDAGSICTLCPSQCNVSFTVRDEKVLRVLARDNHEVDDGWLCDKGRFGFQMLASDERITEPMVRDGGNLREAELGRGDRGAAGRARPRPRQGRGDRRRRASNEEGYLVQRILRGALGSAARRPRARGGVRRASLLASSRAPGARRHGPTSTSPTPCS